MVNKNKFHTCPVRPVIRAILRSSMFVNDQLIFSISLLCSLQKDFQEVFSDF